MSIHTKSEFRALCGGVSINYLDVYIKRKQLIPEKKNRKSKDLFFDDTIEINRAFIMKMQERNGAPVSLAELAAIDERYRQEIKRKREEKINQAPTPEVKPTKKKQEAPKIDIQAQQTLSTPSSKSKNIVTKIVTQNDIDDLSVLELEKKAKILDILRKQEGLEIDRVKLAKLRGESIPVDLMSGVISRLQKSFVIEFHQASEKIIQDLIIELGGNRETIAKQKGLLIATINSSIKKVHEIAIKEIDSIVDDYAIKKSVGERN